MSGPVDRARAESMARLYTGGATLQEIADAFGGISRERVGQIIRSIGTPKRAPEPVDPIRLLAAARRACGLREATREVGTPHAVAKRCLTELGVLPALNRLWAWRQRKRGGGRRWTRHSLIVRMREIGDMVGHTPSRLDLDRYKPAAVTYAYHFGSLSAAHAAAGYVPNAPSQCADAGAWRANLLAGIERRDARRQGSVVTHDGECDRAQPARLSGGAQ